MSKRKARAPPPADVKRAAAELPRARSAGRVERGRPSFTCRRCVPAWGVENSPSYSHDPQPPYLALWFRIMKKTAFSAATHFLGF